MSKKAKIITLSSVLIIIIAGAVFSYLVTMGKISLKAQNESTAYLTNFIAKNTRTGASSKIIHAQRGDLLYFQVTVGASKSVCNPIIYACTTNKYDDTDFQYIDVDETYFLMTKHSNYKQTSYQGAPCKWYWDFAPNWKIGPSTNGQGSFEGPAMRWHLGGNQCSFTGSVTYQFRGRVKTSTPSSVKVIKRGWALAYDINRDGEVLPETWSTGDSTRAIVYLDPTSAACGDSTCNGSENCSTCPKDCPCPAGQQCVSGTCQPIPSCGDGKCNDSETCSTCPKDCGSCPEAIIIGEKSASLSLAKPGDVVLFTLTTKNEGKASGDISIKDDVASIMQYADIIEISNGGTLDKNKKEITYPAITINASGQISRNFKAKVRSANQWAQGGDYKMINTYKPSTASPASSVTVEVGYSDTTAINKFAFNETQSIDAVTKNANPGDVIRYTLTAENKGNLEASSFTMQEDIKEILTYADVIDSSDGKINGTAISWTGSVPGNTQVANTFKVKVKPYDQWPTLGKLSMTNTYGSSKVTIGLQPQSVLDAVVAPSAGVLAATSGGVLASTGTKILLVIITALLIVLIYLIIRVIISRKK